MNEKLRDIFISVGITMLMLMLSFIFTILIVIINDKNSFDILFLLTRICIMISTIIVIYSYHIFFKIRLWDIFSHIKINKKQKELKILLSFILLIFFIFLALKINKSLIIYIIGFGLTAISEELCFRGLIEHQLNQSFSGYYVILIQAIIFAFLGHQGFDLISNLFIRLPLGIVLSLIRRSTGSYTMSILTHFSYDTLCFIL